MATSKKDKDSARGDANAQVQAAPEVCRDADGRTDASGVARTLEVLGGKWKPLIVCVLIQGPLRTGELRRAIPGVSQKVLTQQLRELERDGIVSRETFDELPPRVVYRITDYGRSAEVLIHEMCLWGRRDMLQRGQLE